MRASNLISLLIAVLMLTGMLGVAGVMAEDQTAAQPGAPSGNSTNDVPSNDTIIAPGNNSTIQPPDNIVVPTPVPDNATAPADNTTLMPLTLVLENHTYYPNDTVRVYIFNVTAPVINVIDPSGAIHNLTLTGINSSAFMGEYVLNQSIILANYTVQALDTITNTTAEDTFEVTIRPVYTVPDTNGTISPGNETATQQPFYLYLNLSKNNFLPGESVSITVKANAGAPTIVMQDPADNDIHLELKNIDNDTYSSTYSLDHAIVLGNYTVLAFVNENGAYNYTITYFNVTMSESTAPTEGLNVEYAAYDPAQKAIIVRANINASSDDVEGIVKNSSAVKGLNITGVHIIPTGDNKKSSKNDTKKVEALLPVDNNTSSKVFRQLNISTNITKATISTTMNGMDIHISLNDKVDGCWYRMSLSIPDGYKVLKIIRADGKEIKNYTEINNSTGEIIKNDINWYVDNGILYFYDDPSSGYTVSLSPLANLSPMAANPKVIMLYLHDNGTTFLNTSSSNSSNDHTDYNGNSEVIWIQANPLASNFYIDNTQPPVVSLYLMTDKSGKVKISVELDYTDGTTLTQIGTSNTISNFSNGQITLWTFPINLVNNANVTVPQGDKLELQVYNLNGKINQVYESTIYPSNINLFSTSYIHINNVTVYDALNNQVNGITAPSTIKVVANVTDPFGVQDISNVALTIYYENGTTAIGPLPMNLNSTTIPPSNAWALFESNIPINANQSNGNYTIMVTATSLNGVTDTNSTVLTIVPINVTASKSITLQGGNNFTVTINVTNNNAYTAYGIHAYDFYAGDFNVGSFTQPRNAVPVNNGILQGNINVFGPFNLAPYQKITINYIAQGIGDYRLSNMTIVGVDPYV